MSLPNIPVRDYTLGHDRTLFFRFRIKCYSLYEDLNLRMFIVHFPLYNLRNTYYGILEGCRGHAGSWDLSEGETLMKRLWKATEGLPPLPHDRLMTRLPC